MNSEICKKKPRCPVITKSDICDKFTTSWHQGMFRCISDKYVKLITYFPLFMCFSVSQGFASELSQEVQTLGIPAEVIDMKDYDPDDRLADEVSKVQTRPIFTPGFLQSRENFQNWSLHGLILRLQTSLLFCTSLLLSRGTGSTVAWQPSQPIEWKCFTGRREDILASIIIPTRDPPIYRPADLLVPISLILGNWWFLHVKPTFSTDFIDLGKGI